MYDLLMGLQKHPDPRVRASACSTVAALFKGLPKCLEADNPDPRVREILRAELAGHLNVHNSLDNVRSEPSRMIPWPWNEYLAEMPDMLEIYTDDVRPAVRAAACADLKNFAPERKVANCQ
jgi:hypothetical protein